MTFSQAFTVTNYRNQLDCDVEDMTNSTKTKKALKRTLLLDIRTVLVRGRTPAKLLG